MRGREGGASVEGEVGREGGAPGEEGGREGLQVRGR